MNKIELLDKLAELGIETDNANPKSSFIHMGEVNVGIYGRELKEDFYFFNTFDKKVYKIQGGIDTETLFRDGKTEKFLVPIDMWEFVWEDKPYMERPDAPFKDMTLRDYAAIHLRIPSSNHDWLNQMIKQTSNL